MGKFIMNLGVVSKIVSDLSKVLKIHDFQSIILDPILWDRRSSLFPQSLFANIPACQIALS